MSDVIQLHHVYKTYQNDRHALKNISLNIKENEFVFLTGHSGAGKSTLFKILSAQEKVTSGSAKVLNKDLQEYSMQNVHEYRRQIGIIFQDFKLIHDLTNKENLSIPLQVLNKTEKEIDTDLKQVIDLVGIKESDLEQYPEALSGGEQQKIAIARAIIHRPQVIFADEATGNLDKSASLQVLMTLKELTKWGTTVIFATHDESLLNVFSARHLQLKQGELTGGII